MKSDLVLAALVANVALWLSYVVMGIRWSDFGRVPPELHRYMLVAAGLAYAMNITWIAIFAAREDVHETDALVATACVAAYYGLQLSFVPLARGAIQGGLSRWWTRVLLLVCAVPMGYLAVLGAKYDALLGLLGSLVFAHVLINDAGIYGFSF